MTEAVDDQTEHDPLAAPDEAAFDAPSTPTDAADEIDDTGTAPDAVDPSATDASIAEIDIAGIEADLDGVQAALDRLADGTYWTDEVTGEAIATDVLAADPLARRA